MSHIASHLDREALLVRVDGDEELLAELVDLFVESCPSLLAELRTSVASQDAAQVRASAHALKGSIANFGEGPAYVSACLLEEMGRTRDLTAAQETYTALEQHVEELQLALGEWTH